MATKIYISGGAVIVEGVYTDKQSINPANFDWSVDGTIYKVRDAIQGQDYELGVFGNVQDVDSVAYASAVALENDLNGMVGTAGTNVSDVALQDQHTPTIIAKFNKVTNSTETVGAVAIDDLTVTLDVVTGVAVGSYLIFFSPADVRFMTATVLDISASPVFTIDTPFDFAFPSGTSCDISVTNMNVNGSVTPQIFGLRGVGTPPGVALTADITRIIISCICTSAVDLSKFANFAKLVNGIVMRKRDGSYENIFNIKSNREMAGIMYDWTPFATTNPVQGIDGFVARMTFGGQSKIGVVKRLALGEDLEIIIQDDLATAQSTELITELEIIAEGHIVED